MHKGRFYRQVLPHNLTPDMISRSAPVRLFIFTGFEYAGNLLLLVSEISETLRVDLPTLSIQWRGRIIDGGFEFAYLLQQRIMEGEEGLTFQLVLTDNLGGLLRAEHHWTLDQGVGDWRNFLGFSMGEVVGSVSSGLFGGYSATSAYPISYHQEPP